MTRIDKRTRTNAVADTLINENKSHLLSHLYSVRYNAHIETNSSLQEPMRQEQRTEKDKRHSLNKLNTFNSLSNKNICLTFRTYIAGGFCYVRIKSSLL